MATALRPASWDKADGLLRIFLFLRKIVDGNVRTLAGEGDRGGAANAAIATGDQRLAVWQAPVALVALFAVVGFGGHLRIEAGNGLRLMWKPGLRVLCARILLLVQTAHGR